MAALAAVALWAGLRAWQQEAPPTAEAEEIAELAHDVPTIRPLPPARPIARAVDATARLSTDDRATGRFLVTVTTNHTAPSTMVGILDGDSLAPLRTIPLSQIPTDGWAVDVPIGASPHRLAVAPTAAELRYSYLAATPLHARSTDDPTPVRLDGPTAEVTVALGWFETTPRPLVRLELRRVDDPDWHPAAGCLTDVASTREEWKLTNLGPGQYRIALSGAKVTEDQAGRLEFRLPGPDSARSIAVTIRPGP